MRTSIRGLEDQIYKAQFELQQVNGDYALRAKRQTLEEESLRKRLAIHERNSRELSEKLRDNEGRHCAEVSAIKSQGEARIAELVAEKSELALRVLGLEKQVASLEKEKGVSDAEVSKLREEIA